MKDADPKLTEFLRQACDRTWSELKYKPQRFREMLAELGGVEASKRVLNSREPSEGFNTVYSLGGKELTVEWIVQDPAWRSHFTQQELRTAELRVGKRQ